MSIDLQHLAAPFDPADLEWRVQSCGERNGKVWARVLPYITARAVMNRLDEVLGVDGWQVAYVAGPHDGVMAQLSLRVQHADGSTEWITKCDAADATDVEAVKGAVSSALKRVAVTVGIGRYLYALRDTFAVVRKHGEHRSKTKEGTAFRWDPPPLPVWALPATDPQPSANAAQLEAIESLLGQLDDVQLVRSVRTRVESGLSVVTADAAIRFLQGKLAPRTS